MSTQRPCRFTKTELNKLLKAIPDSEKRLVVKLKHYVKSDIKTLYDEDIEQRKAAALRKKRKESVPNTTT